MKKRPIQVVQDLFDYVPADNDHVFRFAIGDTRSS